MAQNQELRLQNSTPSTPVSGVVKLYADADGALKIVNSQGVAAAVGGSASTPKIYKALLTQTGEIAPVATILENIAKRYEVDAKKMDEEAEITKLNY